jgi:hypothetical protein
MKDLEHIESLWMAERRQAFRREHEAAKWRDLALVAIVAALTGWGALAACLLMGGAL